ncbi:MULTISPECIES: amino acid ABC transporter permease [Agrobacterium tumefaciens complex]|uniref:Amino acid ABC transporter permease n=3 Tax=Rhizobium/Agrobacterium group TaxID=227290 RepID=Q9ADY7_AGRTU|nr:MULTISPECIES: amino acid ABC transporter permease [Agrobacterium tumefaciens complex]NTF34915.1 amino acid ABC transporter permease [Rhizobium skierniewicense]NTJ45251.1 amino acid ABC transporter permease [Agrobacterium larrymoorei]AAK08610.1 GtpC [Agrobacterium tumefaciens]NSL21087.1 amino acid ABC transporter permease [Agrobacterium tumefaciens]NSY52199.1 amino acid ABC transporter permease [Agrobacterium tumefaciens]
MVAMDFAYILEALPDLMSGLRMTLLVSFIAILLSCIIGVIGSIMRTSGVKALEYTVTAYVEFIRGTPFLVQIFFVFYGLPSLGLRFSIFWSGVIALTAWASAFQIENFRAGLAAVDRGMQDASASLGLKRWHYGVFIVLPLAARAALPSSMNTIVATIKNSAYLQAIGLVELTFVAVDRIAYDFRAIEMFASICVIYLLCVFTASGVGSMVERRLNRPFGGW